MQKITEALEKAAAYKKQKEVDAEIDSKEDDTDNEMVGPSPWSQVKSGAFSPTFNSGPNKVIGLPLSVTAAFLSSVIINLQK